MNATKQESQFKCQDWVKKTLKTNSSKAFMGRWNERVLMDEPSVGSLLKTGKHLGDEKLYWHRLLSQPMKSWPFSEQKMNWKSTSELVAALKKYFLQTVIQSVAFAESVSLMQDNISFQTSTVRTQLPKEQQKQKKDKRWPRLGLVRITSWLKYQRDTESFLKCKISRERDGTIRFSGQHQRKCKYWFKHLWSDQVAP